MWCMITVHKSASIPIERHLCQGLASRFNAGSHGMVASSRCVVDTMRCHSRFVLDLK